MPATAPKLQAASMLLDFFKKHDRSAQVAPSNERFVVPAGEKLLTAALDAGLAWPHDCRVGSCGKCRCILKDGKIKPLADFAYTLDHEDIAAGAILACQSQLKSDVVVEVSLEEQTSEISHAMGTISEIDELTHDIVSVKIELDQPRFHGVRAGQYFEVATHDISLPRSYSLARRPDPDGVAELNFVIRHVPGGEFTEWLFKESQTGQQLSLSGPFGDFYLREARERMFCVAGGSGLAPIIAIIEEGLAQKRTDDCIVLFGARTQADLYYTELLNKLGEQWLGKFQLRPILSHENESSDWPGERGLVTSVIPSFASGADFGNDQAYLCGPPAMIDAAIAEFERLGMPNSNIHFDKFLDASSMPAGRV